MKKQIKKLNLNKRTISNLNAVEMNLKIGGAGASFHCLTWKCTQGHTCNGGNNCV